MELQKVEKNNQKCVIIYKNNYLCSRKKTLKMCKDCINRVEDKNSRVVCGINNIEITKNISYCSCYNVKPKNFKEGLKYKFKKTNE